MAYSLSGVKPWVKDAAEELGSKFGIKDIGGYRAGPPTQYNGYDHPLGLALDLMTTKGQGLADYAVANAKRLGVNFVIWNRQIWTPGKGWKSYSGDSDHTDHVHISFMNEADRKRTGAGTGGVVNPGGGLIPGIPDPGDLTGAARDMARGLRQIATQAQAVGDLAGKAMWLTLPTSQVRIAAGFAGILFLGLGVWFIAREAR